jgi:hypothetical protein
MSRNELTGNDRWDQDRSEVSDMSETVICRRCHRPLRRKDSMDAGIGTTCAKRERQEARLGSTGASESTAAKAREDLADGAVQPTSRRTSAGNRVYLAVSSDGGSCYFATVDACTCPAGHRGKYICRHRAAIILRVA